MSRIPGGIDTDYLKQLMAQQQIMPVPGDGIYSQIRPRPSSILRNILSAYIDETAWTFVGDPDEEDRLINMLRRAGINYTVSYHGRKVTIELELK